MEEGRTGGPAGKADRPAITPRGGRRLEGAAEDAGAGDRRTGELSPLPRTVCQTVSKSMEPARSKGPLEVWV